jgi:hypothetical protein
MVSGRCWPRRIRSSPSTEVEGPDTNNCPIITVLAPAVRPAKKTAGAFAPAFVSPGLDPETAQPSKDETRQKPAPAVVGAIAPPVLEPKATCWGEPGLS